MIYKKDLRIGNLVLVDNNIISIIDVMLDGINYSILNEEPMYNYTEIEPIKLTEEIIEKTNLTIISGTNSYENYEETFCIYSENDIWYIENNKATIEVYYLHQLQNIYYFITNTELDINLIKNEN
jgi:hypothetical protein